MPDATVLIVTHNRKEEVLRAVRSAVAQEGDVEVLVIDDGSTDGTADELRAAFPDVRVLTRTEPAEVVARRNEGVELAQSEIVVGIDDDSEFTSPTIVRQTVADFDDPRVGAVAVPFVDLPQDESVRQRAPSDDGVYATQYFVAASCAVRRDAFRAVGGYLPILEHQAEEPDLCIRLLARGYVTRLGRSDPILHYGSPRRSFDRMWFRGTRNDVLFAWHNIPTRRLPVQLARTVAYQIYLGVGVRRPLLFLRAIGAAFALILRGRAKRKPVPDRTYRAWHALGRSHARIDEIADAL